jgi:hypothetical protein
MCRISAKGPKLTRTQATEYTSWREQMTKNSRLISEGEGAYVPPRAFRILRALWIQAGEGYRTFKVRHSITITGGHKDTLAALRRDLRYFCRNGTVCQQIIPPAAGEGWRGILRRIPEDPAAMI